MLYTKSIIVTTYSNLCLIYRLRPALRLDLEAAEACAATPNNPPLTGAVRGFLCVEVDI
jgi:hypothetical protein